MAEKKGSQNEKNENIEIPVGKYLENLRENPWIISTFAFAVLLIVVIAVNLGGSGGANIEKVGSEVINFINSNPSIEGQVSLVSSSIESELYRFNLNYQGQDLVVYTTQDGKLLIDTVYPLSSDLTDVQPTEGVLESQKSADDDAVLGDPNAPVTIVEFSDYQCPFCRKFWTDTLPQLKEEYIDTGRAKLVYRDYPVEQLHPAAQFSAEAAECAREKGGDAAYYKMHDKIFEEQNILDGGQKDSPVTRTVQYSESDVKAWAKEIGYDIDSCLDSGKYEAEVIKDLNDGGQIGTPTFFINGIKLEGAQPYAAFKQVIDNALAQ